LAVLALLLAACGSAQPGVPAGGASPLASLDASGIAADAAVSLKDVSSIHLTGQSTISGQTTETDIIVAGSSCEGTIARPGEGSFEIVRIGPTAWIKPDARLRAWAAAEGAPLGQVPAGLYVKTSSSSQSVASLNSVCDQDRLAASLDWTNGAAKGPLTTVGGERALELTDLGYEGTMYVSTTSPIRLLRVQDQGSYVDFTDYGAPVAVTAPPAIETVDGSKYGI
jgi:hypothetical protein